MPAPSQQGATTAPCTTSSRKHAPDGSTRRCQRPAKRHAVVDTPVVAGAPRRSMQPACIGAEAPVPGHFKFEMCCRQSAARSLAYLQSHPSTSFFRNRQRSICDCRFTKLHSAARGLDLAAPRAALALTDSQNDVRHQRVRHTTAVLRRRLPDGILRHPCNAHQRLQRRRRRLAHIAERRWRRRDVNASSSEQPVHQLTGTGGDGRIGAGQR